MKRILFAMMLLGVATLFVGCTPNEKGGENASTGPVVTIEPQGFEVECQGVIENYANVVKAYFAGYAEDGNVIALYLTVLSPAGTHDIVGEYRVDESGAINTIIPGSIDEEGTMFNSYCFIVNGDPSVEELLSTEALVGGTLRSSKSGDVYTISAELIGDKGTTYVMNMTKAIDYYEDECQHIE